MIKRILFTGDWHCGSRQGLTHPDYWNEYTPEGAKWLWEKWLQFGDEAGKVDLIVLTADLIDGTQRRSEGTGMVTTSLGEQVEMAKKCFETLCGKGRRIIRVIGTAYHESFHGPLRDFDTEFGIDPPKDIARQIIRDIKLNDNALLNVKHQPEGAGALYRGTIMDREVLWASMTELIHHIPKATHIVRAHLHSYNTFSGHDKVITMCPCFCLKQPYAMMKCNYRWTPNIGGLIMERHEHGHYGWFTYPIIYPFPAFEGETYEEL